MRLGFGGCSGACNYNHYLWDLLGMAELLIRMIDCQKRYMIVASLVASGTLRVINGGCGLLVTFPGLQYGLNVSENKSSV